MYTDSDDYDDPEILAQWVDEQREHVLEYLVNEGVSHDNMEDCIPDEPDFCIAPYLAVWRVMSHTRPENVDYWVISGDLPTDYVSSRDARDAREVLIHFSRSWGEVVECMKAGKEHPTITLGPPEMWPTLASILEDRVTRLSALADDDDIWEEDEQE